MPVMGKRSKYGNNSICYQTGQHIAPGLFHISDVTVVDVLHRTFVRTQNIQIGSGHTECIDSESLQSGNDVFIYQSAIHHCYHSQSVGISNTTPIYHTAGNTQLLGQFRRRTTTSVNKQLTSFYGRKIPQ